eukprot:Phypoly_transcript_07648.p1 GENE.Phypoly_transcript_07648~~Phypoly_transcript_07648.p1  ORF type:complete len:487 (+),score=88.56 Phypoly_transcript_07648:95-1555(+)
MTSSALHEATNAGDLAKVKELVERGEEKLDQVDGEGETALSLAAKNGNLDIVRFLLKKGANARRYEGMSSPPLFNACRAGHVEVARKLLKYEADPEGATTIGNKTTPLIIAAKHGSVEITQMLIDHGANVNTARMDSVTPIFMAAQENHVEVLKMLIKAGANVDACTDDDATPLFMAAQEGHAESVEILLQNHAKMDAIYSNGNTPLLAASMRGNLDIVKMLVKWGANINERVETADSLPLIVAAQNGHLEVVKFFVGLGAHLDGFAYPGTTALYMASLHGESKVVKYLLECGANPNITREDGGTPLFATCHAGYGEVALTLLKYGAQVNVGDRTARDLFASFCKHAADECSYKVAIELYERGLLDDYQITSDVSDPLHFAIYSEFPKMVWLIVLKSPPTYFSDASLWVPPVKTYTSTFNALRRFWTPSDFHFCTKEVQDAIISFLLVAKSQNWKFDNFTKLHIIGFIVGGWEPIKKKGHEKTGET